MWHDNPKISIVIPIYNEEENLRTLYERLREVLEGMGVSWEVVVVDDGSRDGSMAVLRSICEEDGRVKAIQLRRNFGQTAAMSAGFDYARGQIIVTMDGDLQNDAADIPALVQKIDEGYDIASGWRKGRKDPFLPKRLPSLLSNRLASWMTGVALHDYGCTLKAYRRDVIEEIHLYGELHRYIPAVANVVGARVAEVEVTHHARVNGKSKYGMSRLVRGFLDLIALKLLTSYLTRPMQIFGGLGLLTIFLGLISAVSTVSMKLFMEVDMTGNPLLYLMMLSFVLGIQFISLGFLSEISIRTYYETLRKPIYVIKEIIGEEDERLAVP